MDFQTIGLLIAAASVSVATIYYLFIVRATFQTRQAQLFMGIYEAYYSNDFRDSDYALFSIEMKNMDDWNKLVKNRKMWNAFWQETLYFTGVGVLVRQNLIDIHLVTLLLSESVFWYWEKYRDGIMECRKGADYPRLGVEVEYLYNRISDYAREHPQLGVTAPKVTFN